MNSKFAQNDNERLNKRLKTESIPSFPTFFQQIKNLTETLNDFIKDQFKLSDENLWKTRFEICRKCKYFKNNRCSKCGCYTRIKSKIKAAKCPLDFWNNLIIIDDEQDI